LELTDVTGQLCVFHGSGVDAHAAELAACDEALHYARLMLNLV
jgi:hypothetical protein